jgi:hypothetical protein
VGIFGATIVGTALTDLVNDDGSPEVFDPPRSQHLMSNRVLKLQW